MKDINGWVRQARHRAKRYSCTNDLTISDIQDIWQEHSGKCGYCGSDACSLDNPLPLSDGGPNVPANVVPCCNQCKITKRNRSLGWMYEIGLIPESDYVALMRRLLLRRGADQMRASYRQHLGISHE